MNVLPTKDELEVMETIANILLKSGFYPQVKTQDQAVATILRGWGLGLSPADSLSGINILHGKLAMSSGLIAALMMRAGFYWKSVSHTDLECIIEVFNANGVLLGNAGFAMEDAKRALLISKNQNWTIYPKDMLFARTISAAARRYAPVAFGGSVYTPDELEDTNKRQNPRRLPVPSAQQTDEITDSDTRSNAIPPTSGTVKLITLNQTIEMNSIAKDMGMGDDARHDLIATFTSGKTRTSKELSIAEADDFIHLMKIEWAGQLAAPDGWSKVSRDAVVKSVSDGTVASLWLLRGEMIDKAHHKVAALASKTGVELPARLLPQGQ